MDHRAASAAPTTMGTVRRDPPARVPDRANSSAASRTAAEPGSGCPPRPGRPRPVARSCPPDGSGRAGRRRARPPRSRSPARARAAVSLRQPRLGGLRGRRRRACTSSTGARRRRTRTLRSTRRGGDRRRALAAAACAAEIVSQRLNRRKIDLIPGAGVGRSSEGADRRAARGGGGAASRRRARRTRRRGRGRASRPRAAPASPNARVTSDAKHVEIGLTDKSDAARWVFAELARRGVGPGLVADRRRRVRAARRPARKRLAPARPRGGARRPRSRSAPSRPASRRASSRSAAGLPASCACSTTSSSGGAAATCRSSTATRAGRSPSTGLDPRLERVHESLLTLADGRLGTRGAPLFDDPVGRAGRAVVAGVYTRRRLRDRARARTRLDAATAALAAERPPRPPAARPRDGPAARGGAGHRRFASPRSRGPGPSRCARNG